VHSSPSPICSMIGHCGYIGFKSEPPENVLVGDGNDDETQSEHAVRQISLNRTYGCALLADGSIREWGTGLCSERLTSPLPTLPSYLLIRSISCGAGHVVAAIESGGVISWGSGQIPTERLTPRQTQILGIGDCASRGQCIACSTQICEGGANEVVSSQLAKKPRVSPVEQIGEHAWWVGGALRHRRVLQVSAGDSYSAAIVLEDYPPPNANSAAEASAASSEMAACESHTRASSANTSLWTWGVGDSGQLGLGRAAPSYSPEEENKCAVCSPRQIVFPTDGSAKSSCPSRIACGPFHAAVVDSEGKLYTFGSGTHCQLGHGEAKDEWSPRLVESLLGVGTLRKNGTSGGIAHPNPLSPSGLSSVACGLWHTAAISDSGDLYTWGWGRFGQLGQTENTDDGVFENETTNSFREGHGEPNEIRRNRSHGSVQDFVQSSPRLCSDVEGAIAVSAGSRHTAYAVNSAGLLTPSDALSSSTKVHYLGHLGPALEKRSTSQSEKGVGDRAHKEPLLASGSDIAALASGPWCFCWYASKGGIDL